MICSAIFGGFKSLGVVGVSEMIWGGVRDRFGECKWFYVFLFCLHRFSVVLQ